MEKKVQMERPNALQRLSIIPENVENDVAPRSLIKLDKKMRKKNFRTNSIISLPVSSVSAFSGFTAVTTSSSVKPKRSIAGLLLNGSIMFGREYCYAIEASLTTPILLGIGLPVHLYSLIWVISPILGFVLQPVLGGMSDRCKLKWGRRRPFIFTVSILLMIGMTLFLNGQEFVENGVDRGIFEASNGRTNVFWTIGIVVTGVIIFDFSADFVEGPIRAYVMDVCDKDDVKRGLYYQAIFTGFGGAFGYASAGISWVRYYDLGQYFATDQQVIYVLAAAIFTCCVAMNLTSIPEKQMKSIPKKPAQKKVDNKISNKKLQKQSRNKLVEDNESDHSKIVHSRRVKIKDKRKKNRIVNDSHRHNEINYEGRYIDRRNEFSSSTSHWKAAQNMSLQSVISTSVPDSKNYTSQWVSESRKWNFFGADHYKSRRVLPFFDGPRSSYGTFIPTDSDSSISSRDSELFGISPALDVKILSRSKMTKKSIDSESDSSKTSYCRLPEQLSQREKSKSENRGNSFKQIITSILQTPREIKLLCIAHLFGWMGFLCLVLFFTDFVGQTIYDGDPMAPPGTPKGDAYKRGVEFGSWGMAINAASSSLYCFFLKPMIRILGARVVYFLGYFAFSLGALGMTLLRHKIFILVLSSLIGVMSGTLYTLPYFLVSKYHESYKRFRGTSFERGVGADCALVTCMIQLAQIIVGLGIGALVTWLNTVTVTVAAASVISFVGSIYVLLFVKC